MLSFNRMTKTRKRAKRNNKKRRSLRGGSIPNLYVAASLEFELPEKFPVTLSEEQIEEIKMKIGKYFGAGKVPITYFGQDNDYHIFTTLGSKSAYFNLSGGSAEPSAGVYVDFEVTLDSHDGQFIMMPPNLTSSDISELKTKIRYMVKDSAQNLIYKGLFNNMHVFVSDPNVIHGRQF